MHSSNRSSNEVEVAAPSVSPFSSHTRRNPLNVRCECGVCGAHSYARPDRLDEERCGNCLSTGLAPIQEVASPPARWGSRRHDEVRVRRGPQHPAELH